MALSWYKLQHKSPVSSQRSRGERGGGGRHTLGEEPGRAVGKVFPEIPSIAEIIVSLDQFDAVASREGQFIGAARDEVVCVHSHELAGFRRSPRRERSAEVGRSPQLPSHLATTAHDARGECGGGAKRSMEGDLRMTKRIFPFSGRGLFLSGTGDAIVSSSSSLHVARGATALPYAPHIRWWACLQVRL